MSITTKRGDTGQTDLLYSRRVAKDHPRIAALGAVDELSAALGLARIYAGNANTAPLIDSIQRELISLMGLLAITVDDYPRYLKDGFESIDESHVSRLTCAALEIERDLPRQTDWVLPGAAPSAAAAHLELARAICRRAEAAVVALTGADAPPTPHLIPYLNRLADLLWLLARLEEKPV